MTDAQVLDTHHAIFGSSGLGKTVTAKSEVEQLLANRRHLAIIDPTGVWWGLRSNARGDGAGFDILIFGGEHGDVPIGAGDGEAVAGIIVDQNVSAIVDLSALDSDEDQRAFVDGFASRLRSKPRGNFHLYVDEADVFCPQPAPDKLAFALTQKLRWFGKRSRVSGFVLTLITQRPADIDRSVLSQAKTIIAHGLVDPRDRKAIDDYLRAAGDDAARKRVMASLPQLGVGERWIYSPRLGILERGRTPPISTFDSSAAPVPGEERREPKMLAQLDVSAIRAALAKPERATAVDNEVSELLAERDLRIQELECEVFSLQATLEEERRFARKAKLVVDRAVDILKPISHSRTSSMNPADLEAAHNSERAAARFIGVDQPDVPSTRPAGPDGEGTAGEADPPSPAATSPAPRFIGVDLSSRPDIAARATVDGSGKLVAVERVLGAERKSLAALAGAAPAGLTDAQWATQAGYKRSGGTWTTYRSRLKVAGLIEQRGKLWHATAAGVAAIGADAVRLPKPGPELLEHWAARVPGGGRMLRRLGQLYPKDITRDGLAADLGMAAGGGTFGTYLSRLRANGLLEERGKRLRAAPALMGDAK